MPANESSCPGSAIDSTIPITLPSLSSSGPPELPGFTEASNWISPENEPPLVRAVRPVADSTPDAFEFAPQTNVAPGTVVTSNAVKVTGINAPAPVSVQGGTLLVNGQPSSQTSVQAGDMVALRLTASGDYASSASARLTVGDVTADFSVTTRLAPNAPTPGPLTLSASALQFTATGADQRQSVTASQTNYTGGFAVGGSCQTIATLTTSRPAAGALAVAVTPTAAGRCTLQISSATATASVNVTITTSGVVVN